MPLTQLQVRVAQLLREMPGAEAFALAGGGAMAALGIGDRRTQDLDFFAGATAVVDEFAPLFAQACEADGLAAEEVLVNPGFHRFSVSDGRDATLVDLAWDARLRAPQETPFGLVLDRDELAADKLLALFGRGAPRDFVDVYRLRSHYTRDELYALASEKDRGFNQPILAEMFGKLFSYERTDFPVDDETFAELQREFETWRQELVRTH